MLLIQPVPFHVVTTNNTKVDEPPPKPMELPQVFGVELLLQVD